MNLEQALDELSRWEREAKRLEAQLRESNQLLFDAGALMAAREKELKAAASAINEIKIDAGEQVAGILQKSLDVLAGYQKIIDMCREHFEKIAAYDTDFATGPAENVNRLQAMAEVALAALPPKL